MPNHTTGARETPTWVAAYGSLMRGLGGAERAGVDHVTRFVGPCVLEGELFDLGDWPGMRPGHGRVVGEIHALLDASALARMDSFEDYDPTDPCGSLYLRERVKLLEPEGVEVWTYFYNYVPDASARVPNGDWRAWLAERD